MAIILLDIMEIIKIQKKLSKKWKNKHKCLDNKL